MHNPILAFLIVLITALTACSGADRNQSSPPGEQAVVPEPTPVGTPTGEVVTQTIGPEGGTLSSADGIVTLTIPPGAVAAATEFGVQPITNNAPASVGGAYRLTPDGHVFATPAQISMKYDDAEIQATAPSELSLGYQNAQGVWEWQEDPLIDTVDKTITISTPHLSDWSRVYGLQIQAQKDSVNLKESVLVEVLNCVERVNDGGALLFKCRRSPSSKGFSQVDGKGWAVNGITLGNLATGHLTDLSNEQAVYTAPDEMPHSSDNPVNVSVKTKKGGLLNTHILVKGGEFHVSMTFSQANSGYPCPFGVSDMTDHAEFTMTPGDGVEFSIDGIVNGKTAFSPPVLQPPNPLAKLKMDSDPEWLTIVSGTGSSTDIAVSAMLNVTTTTGGCSFIVDGTPPITAPGQTGPTAPFNISFDKSKFVNGTQTFPDASNSWPITVTE